MRVEIADALQIALAPPPGTYRYRVLRGGRGSGKSFSAAKIAAIWGAAKSMRILCTREFQNSIKQSFYAELSSAIKSEPWLTSQYDVGRDFIRHKTNGTEFLFSGLRHNIDSIKSMAQIDLCIVEEAETVPHQSWRDLLPTIRAEGSEFIIIYNPRSRDSWVAQQFDGEKLPPRTVIATVNHEDNPWFPRVLDEQRLHDRETLDPALYRHIWEGAYYEQSDAQIFSGKYVCREFEPGDDWDGPYFGVDWGFSQSPTVGVKCWIHDSRLYVEHEAYKRGLDLDDTSAYLIRHLPGIADHVVRADSARPETISHVKHSRDGKPSLPRIVAVKKGPGSIEDGIAHLRSYREIVVHPRCKNTLNDLAMYSYKIDRNTGDPLPKIVDAYNDTIDSIRYAIEPLIKRRGGFLALSQM